MTSDISEDFKDLRKQRQDKREANRERGAATLNIEGIPFTEHNGGAHLIVAGDACDYWPGTGRWIFRNGGKRGFGVRNLINALKEGAAHA